MKTAEEWKIYFESEDSKAKMRQLEDAEMWISICTNIQLDAFKAGAEWAAAISEKDYSSGGSRIQQAILTAVANLKEIPK